MEPSIFGYIRAHSWRQQLVILVLTVLSFPPLYYSLELPKTIINQALAHPENQHVVFGQRLDIDRGRVIFDLWDDDVTDAIDSGYLTVPRVPRATDPDWQPHALAFARDTGLL